MGDMGGGGGVKNLKKEVTYFVNGPLNKKLIVNWKIQSFIWCQNTFGVPIE